MHNASDFLLYAVDNSTHCFPRRRGFYVCLLYLSLTLTSPEESAAVSFSESFTARE